jgi:hypothetical protein
MPAVRVGPLQAAPGKAACADVLVFHKTLGDRVHGVVPAEFLRGKIFRIDFDAGRLQFLRSVPDDAGDRFDLTWKAGAPWLELDVPDIGKEQFLIASDRGFKTGSLREELFDRLAAAGRLWVRRSKDDSAYSAVELAAMWLQWGSARLDRFVVGQFRHEGAIFSAAPHSRLGLGYLSRYNVTFDLAHLALYLKRGRDYSRPDGHADLAQVWIAPVNGNVDIINLEEGGPAAQAGLDFGDEIVEVDNVLTDEMSIFENYRLFATPGKRTLRFRRHAAGAVTETETTMVLKGPDDAKAAHEPQHGKND